MHIWTAQRQARQNVLRRQRYRNDPEYRQKRIEQAKDYYHRKRWLMDERLEA